MNAPTIIVCIKRVPDPEGPRSADQVGLKKKGGPHRNTAGHQPL